MYWSQDNINSLGNGVLEVFANADSSVTTQRFTSPDFGKVSVRRYWTGDNGGAGGWSAWINVGP